MDDFWRKASQPPAQDGPHKTPLHLLHARLEGREEVLFHRMPGEPRKLQHQWGDLSSFRELLRIAVDELEAETPTASQGTITPEADAQPTEAAPSEPDLSDVLQGMDDEHGLPLPELAQQIAVLADDLDAGSFITEPLRRNAAELSKSARLQFRDTSMERREVEPGRWQWMKRNPANRQMNERRLEHHLSQAVALLSDLQDGRKAADTPAKLRTIAKGIEQAAPRPADPSDTARPAEQGTKGATPTMPTPTHSADFTFVNWYGTEYTFALGVQSSAVHALWDDWVKSGLGLHQDTIRNTIDAERDNFRMDKAFRKHPAFGTMIQSIGDGKYKLAPPTVGKPQRDSKMTKSAGIPAKPRRRPR
jgi:hypothetical protein